VAISFVAAIAVVLVLQATMQGTDRAGTMQGPGEWGTPTLVENDDGTVWIGLDVEHDSAGNAIAVWNQRNGTDWPIFSNRYVKGVGWEAPEMISDADFGNSNYPRVSVNSSGNAVCVWQQESRVTRHYSILANWYVVGAGWGTPSLVEFNETGNTSGPDVFTLPDGGAVAVWEGDAPGSNYSVWANRYGSSGWGTPELLETEAGGITQIQVASNPSGDGIAVWSQTNGTYYHIWAARYYALSGWEVAELVEEDAATYAFYPKPALDSNGNAIVVWSASETGYDHIWANRYEVGKGWGNATRLEKESSLHASYPGVAVDSDGNAIAVFTLRLAYAHVQTSRYVVGTGWGDPVPIENNPYDVLDPIIDFDSLGNAICAWCQITDTPSGIFSIWVNRYDASAGWGTARSIGNTGTGNAYDPRVSCDPSGNAIVVWRQGIDTSTTRFDLWANTYEAPVIPEFSVVITPIVSIIAVAVLVSFSHRRKRED